MKTENDSASCSRTRIIRRASLVGIVGNLVLSAAKIIAGVLGHSLALLGDGIDSFTDVLTSTVTYYTAGIVEKPPDLMHPYGHGRAETIATKALSFIIFFAGAQLLFSTVGDLFGEGERELPATYALIIAGLSVLGKVGLAFNKYRAGKKAESSMLIADAKNMTMDVGISLSVLIGLFFTVGLQLPIIDSFIAIVVAGWIMWIGFGIFIETSTELMDGLGDRSIYLSVSKAASSVEGVRNPHKMRIRKLNTSYFVDMDVEIEGEKSISEGHELVRQVHRKIQEEVPKVHDVHIHMEPVGNEEQKERFGVSREELQKHERLSDKPDPGERSDGG